MKNFKGIEFKGTFRVYQQKVLDVANKHLKDGKIHIVAAPGSGKTILGCELIRRLNNPCLIFSPTVTIREQWGDRFNSWFLNGEEKYDELISNDLFNVKLINSVTYQALHSAMNNVKIKDEQEDYDYSGIDIYQLMKENGIKTICLDEAHHLKNEWQRSLEKFISNLDKGIKIISLTATPPYDSSESEWNRYIDVCGEIDEEIFVPELVKQNTLCPHQDFVYFSYPTNQETEEYNKYKENVNNAILEICNHQILKDLSENLCKNYEKIYNDLYMKAQELTSLFVLFNYAGIEYSKKCEKMLTAQEKLPEYSEKHADTAINFILDSNLISDFEKSEIKNILRKYEVYENKNASLDLSEKIKKTLTSSMSKLDSISRIVEIENESLKEKLRMLILTDFIKKDSVNKINTTENFDSISIVSIFEVLRRQNNDLRLGVLSGAIVILPSDLKDNIKNEIEINESEYSFKEIEGTKYSLVNFKGGNKNKVKYVSELFEKGLFNVLVGTKSLLGEGWDSPCINSLILASFIGSFVLSNQMRGRAIRIYKNDPEKCSNIWHLVTLEPKDGIKSKILDAHDYSVLSRRFESFVGPNYETGEIESGIDRISNIKPPYTEENIQTINANTETISQDRERTKKQWLEDTKFSTDVGVETKIPVNKRLPSFNIVGIISITMILALEVLLGIFIFKQSGIVKVVLLVGYLFVILYLLRFLIALCYKVFLHINAKNSIKTLTSCILKSLQGLKEIGCNCELVVTKNRKANYVGVILKNASIHEQNIFNKTITELFTQTSKPRYILVYKNMFNIRDYHRSFICPEIFGDNKKKVKILTDNFHLKYTDFDAIYIQNDYTMSNLRKCRNDSYIFNNLEKIEKKQKLVK